MKKQFTAIIGLFLTFSVAMTGCSNSEQIERSTENSSVAQVETTTSSESEGSADGTAPESQGTENILNKEENIEMKMNVQVGDTAFTATLEENEAVDALVKMMEQRAVTIQMRDYSGFEKVGSLGTSLPDSNKQTTTQAGDIVLYQGNQIVIFYGSNSWSYTRLGHIDDLTGWEEALGSGDVTVTFSLED